MKLSGIDKLSKLVSNLNTYALDWKTHALSGFGATFRPYREPHVWNKKFRMTDLVGIIGSGASLNEQITSLETQLVVNDSSFRYRTVYKT